MTLFPEEHLAMSGDTARYHGWGGDSSGMSWVRRLAPSSAGLIQPHLATGP